MTMIQCVLICVEVVEEQPADREVLEVVEAGGRGPGAAQLFAQLVVVGVIRERDVGEETAGLVLQVAQHRRCSTRDPRASRRDRRAWCSWIGMPSSWASRCTRIQSSATASCRRWSRAPRAEHFGPAARQRVEPRLLQRVSTSTDVVSSRFGEVRDLDRGERLDVHLGVPRLEALNISV